MRYIPRAVAKRMAAVGGYFWLPCPLCGRYEAGFEWDGRSWSSAYTMSHGRGFCSRHPFESLVLWNRELYSEDAGRRIDGHGAQWRPMPGAVPTGLHLGDAP